MQQDKAIRLSQIKGKKVINTLSLFISGGPTAVTAEQVKENIMGN